MSANPTSRNWFITGVNSGFGREMTEHTPASMVHTMIRDTSRLPNGDPARMARLIIESAEQSPAPKRLLLGSDAYSIMHKALTERLASLEAQKDSAASTDFPAKSIRNQ